MKNRWTVSVALLSVLASFATAAEDHEQHHNNEDWAAHGNAFGHDHQAVAAPEIDPGQAMGALVMLGGALAIIRGYRRKK